MACCPVTCEIASFVTNYTIDLPVNLPTRHTHIRFNLTEGGLWPEWVGRPDWPLLPLCIYQIVTYVHTHMMYASKRHRNGQFCTVWLHCVDGHGCTITTVLYQTSHICAKTKLWLECRPVWWIQCQWVGSWWYMRTSDEAALCWQKEMSRWWCLSRETHDGLIPQGQTHQKKKDKMSNGVAA